MISLLRLVPVVALLALLLAADASAAGRSCGTARRPATDATLSIRVAKGTVTCAVARRVVLAHLRETLTGDGVTTQSAGGRRWGCGPAAPTSRGARRYQCGSADKRIRVLATEVS